MTWYAVEKPDVGERRFGENKSIHAMAQSELFDLNHCQKIMHLDYFDFIMFHVIVMACSYCLSNKSY